MRTFLLVALGLAVCEGFTVPIGTAAPTALQLSALQRATSLRMSASSSHEKVQVSRREALWTGLAALSVLAAPAPSLAADNAGYKGELAGSDGMGVDVSFSYPKSWKLEQKPGALLVTDQSNDACLEDPDKCDVGEIIAR